MHPALRSSAAALLLVVFPASAGPPGQVSSPVPHPEDDPVLHRVTPSIPFGVENYEHTRQAHCEVDFTIDRKGRPKHIEVGGCVPCYESVIKQAAHQWRFAPGTRSYHTSFDFEVEVTDPEPREPVMSAGAEPGELTVHVSIPVLSLIMSLETDPGDGWPPPHPGGPELVKRSMAFLDSTSFARMQGLTDWYGLDEVSCSYRIWVDEQGRPHKWKPRDCSAMFHEAADATVAETRWAPLVVDGEPRPFTTGLGWTFIIRPPDQPRE